MKFGLLMQIVYFYQSNSGHVVYTTHDRGVVTRRQVYNDGRIARVSWSIAAVYDLLDLVVGDNPADDRSPPVIIRGNQSSCAIVDLQCWISQRIGNVIWRRTELRANGAYNYPL